MDNLKAKPILRTHHAILLTLINTFNCLVFKSLCAFIAYIIVDYGFSYNFTVSILSVGSLATAASFIVNPLMLHLPTNAVFSIFALLECISCLILWYFRHNKALFAIAVIISFLIQNVHFGCSNAVISTFVTKPDISHQYLSALNASWTIATFIFLGVGYVMELGSIWLYLEILIIIFFLLTILSVFLFPKISANKYNLEISNANLPQHAQTQSTVSIKNDLAVLYKIKAFWIVAIALILFFFSWGYFYSSFGVWLKQLFHFSQQTFGDIVGLSEGIGNLCGILCITYLTKSDGAHHDGQHGNKYKLTLQSMMLFSTLVMTIAMIVICITNLIEWYDEIFLFSTIGIYFFGQEAAVVAALILIVNMVPPLQQARASSMVGIVQSFSVFISQLTVAPLYARGGMKWELVLLVLIYIITLMVVIYLYKTMKEDSVKKVPELLPINAHKSDIQKYT